jgi:hypothetical protein
MDLNKGSIAQKGYVQAEAEQLFNDKINLILTLSLPATNTSLNGQYKWV